MSNLITAEELAKRINLRPDTIRRWARAGTIPSLKLSGKVVRFDAAEVELALRTLGRENQLCAHIERS